MLLAIDTSAGTSVAVVDRDAGILAERSSADTRRHAELIGSFILESLEESGIAVTDLAGVVIGMGPGPFTGLRVGIAAARAFALGSSKPLLPVVSHDAVAWGHPAPTLVVADARRREVYWSSYSGQDELGLPLRNHGPALARPDDLPTEVPDYDSFERIDVAEVSAGSLGMLAAAMVAAGREFVATEPLYLRSPDVTISAGPKRVSS